jgi:TfoX/Sxy family transcriptional regulator of competence genes
MHVQISLRWGVLMATTSEFIEYVCERIGTWQPEYKKMFGEYMVYVNRKPVFLVCDNTVYVKELPELQQLMENADRGTPYEGAKEHYIIDIDDSSLLAALVPELERLIPVPVKKRR